MCLLGGDAYAGSTRLFKFINSAGVAGTWTELAPTGSGILSESVMNLVNSYGTTRSQPKI